MLQVARLAPTLLSDAAERVGGFLREQFNPDGGARDRAGRSDLYYTVFAMDGLIALRREPPVEAARGYLAGFGDGEGLDLVHQTCLARCWGAMPAERRDAEACRRLAGRIAGRRAPDGGFGSTYHSFLAAGALEDLGFGVAEPQLLARSIAWPEPGRPATTPTTAGAVTLLRHLGAPVPPEAGAWLLARAHPQGGFTAAEGTPVPDLLSTATALHALAGLKAEVGPLKEATLDFIDSLWTGKAFCGSWGDEEQDAEYAYYALLALGHLSLV
jgi:hypothetical protein